MHTSLYSSHPQSRGKRLLDGLVSFASVTNGPLNPSDLQKQILLSWPHYTEVTLGQVLEFMLFSSRGKEHCLKYVEPVNIYFCSNVIRVSSLRTSLAKQVI